MRSEYLGRRKATTPLDLKSFCGNPESPGNRYPRMKPLEITIKGEDGYLFFGKQPGTYTFVPEVCRDLEHAVVEKTDLNTGLMVRKKTVAQCHGLFAGICPSLEDGRRTWKSGRSMG